MNDFDDVQKQAQQMTQGVTDGSPAKKIQPMKNDDTTYAGFGRAREEKTKTSGSTTIVDNPNEHPFALPYTGGGSYQGAKIYGAQINPDPEAVVLKSKFQKVEPYDLTVNGVTGKVDTLNLRKAAFELLDAQMPQGVDLGWWSGYDKMVNPPHEDFATGFARNLYNGAKNVIIGAAAGVGDLTSDISKAYGEVFNDQDAIDFGNYLLSYTPQWTNDVMANLNWDYGADGDNTGENKTGVFTGSLVGSMIPSIMAGRYAAGTFAVAEGLGNEFVGRQAALDRGVSGLKAAAIGYGAGLGTAALGYSTKMVEGIMDSLMKPAVGWARLLKESPKRFALRKGGENLLLTTYDSMTESLQDALTAYLGQGRLKGEDWENAWLTFLYGGMVGASLAAMKTHADKKYQGKVNAYAEEVMKFFDASKETLDKIVKESNGAITQETIDAYRDYLISNEGNQDFFNFAMNRVAENLDRMENIPDDMKGRLKTVLTTADGQKALSGQMAIFDERVDQMLSQIQDAPKASVEAAREFLRGVALYDYLYRGNPPANMSLPTIVADVEVGKGNAYTDAEGVIHIFKNVGNVLETQSQKLANIENYKGPAQTSAQVKNQAIAATQGSERATTGNPAARAKTLHELMHWAEKRVGLENSAQFVRRMTAWSNEVLPQITVGKDEGSLARSEAYAYAVEYAKSLKDLLGLKGNMRDYIELFNAVSSANDVATAFEVYNKMLSQTMKENASFVNDVLSSNPDLRKTLAHYVETGNVGIMSQEDLKGIYKALSTIVDGETGSKLATALGDASLAQSFVERYEAEYDAEQDRLAQRTKRAYAEIDAKKQEFTPSIAQQSDDLQTDIIANTDVSESQVSDNSGKQEPKQEPKKDDTVSETQEPPFRQFSGEPYPLVRDRENAQWIERYLDGEKIPVDVFEGMKTWYTGKALQAIGILPKKGSKYSIRQNESSNKPEGVMSIEWQPTEEELKSIGVSDRTKLSSDQLTAVGRYLATLDADAVYSISDDIDTITGGGNDNAFNDMIAYMSTTTDQDAIMFIQEAEQVVTALQNFSERLTHKGTNLSQADALYELSLIERARDLQNFDVNTLKNAESKQIIKKFLNNIDNVSLAERFDYLTDIVTGYQEDYLALNNIKYSKKVSNPDPFAKIKTENGYKYVSPFQTAKEYLSDPKYFDISYWLGRMGQDVDLATTVEALESYVKRSGLEPVDFSNIVVRVGDKDVPLFQSNVAQPAQFGAIYGHQGLNPEVNIDFNIKALNTIFNVPGDTPSRDKLVLYLLNKVAPQIPENKGDLSIADKTREIAALARAKQIANELITKHSRIVTNFDQWATLTQEGNVGLGADVAGLAKDTKQANFEELQNKEIADGKTPYISAGKNINVFNMKAGTQIAFLYSGSWKQGVITGTNLQTKDKHPYYVIRVLNDGNKGVYDLIWDAREFEILQKTPMGKYENALFIKPDVLDKDSFKNIVSDEYWKANYVEKKNKDGTLKDPDAIIWQNYTARAHDAKVRKREILYRMGFHDVENIIKLTDDDTSMWSISDEDFKNWVGDESVFDIGADEYVDPFPDIPDEEFDNVDTIRSRTITGTETTNEEVYQKLKLAEDASRRPVSNYLDRYVPGLGERMVPAIKKIYNTIEKRKVRPSLFFLTGGVGPQSRFVNLMGEELASQFGFNMRADQAERIAMSFKKDLEKAMLDSLFKNQKELGEWQVKIGVDLKDIKAEMSDGETRPITRDEIMTLYLAELSRKGNDEFRLPFVYGGIIEENGNSYMYNKLKAEYKNFDQLVATLSKKDKDAAEILSRFLPVLRGVDMNNQDTWFGRFVPVTTFEDYSGKDGWANRKYHNNAVFGTRLLDKNSRLVASGAFATAMSMSGSAGVRQSNYISGVQSFVDMMNLAALNDPATRVSRGFRQDIEPGSAEEAQLQEAIEWSNKLRTLVEQKIGAGNMRSLMADLDKVLEKNQISEPSSWIMSFVQKLTRTSSAQALSLKPRQAFTNFFGNYMVLGGLSSHNPLWYNSVGLIDGIRNFRTAWADMLKNPTFKARLEQAALSEQYKRAADMKGESLIQDIEKVMIKHEKEGTANFLAMADSLAKVMTKYSIGVTNTLPDMAGLALGRYIVLNDVRANIMAQAQAEKRTMSEKELDIATENAIADYMFSHISSSNVMARGRWSKNMARMGLEGMVAFKNDQLQKTASFANAVTKLMNTSDPTARKQAWHEIEGILLSSFAYVAIQAGLVFAMIRTLSGDDLNDKEKEYLQQSLLRESLAQFADAFNGGTVTQSLLESLAFGRAGGMDFLPMTDVNRLFRNIRKGDYWMAGASTLGMAGFSPMERAVVMSRALSMAFGDDERAAAVGRLMLAGRGEATAKNMLGLTTNKAGKIVPKKNE